MSYVEGFVLAVPTDKKDEYLSHAVAAVPIFKDFGVTRHVEAWGEDVPDGKVTDFKGAVQAKEGESIVFSWFEYPSKAVRDSANERMMSDPRMKEMGESMPFDGRRMIVSGFAPMLDEGDGDRMGYTDGFVAPARDREAYLAMAAKAAPIFIEHGATRVVEAWGDDVRDGKVTDFRKAVKAEEGENVVFSWIEWPDKETRVAGWEKVMADERLKPPEAGQMPFDGKRMFWGGFDVLLDSKAGIGLESATEREPA
jgi:uncharacterized protein YbaA (DUF1428 family)